MKGPTEERGLVLHGAEGHSHVGALLVGEPGGVVELDHLGVEALEGGCAQVRRRDLRELRVAEEARDDLDHALGHVGLELAVGVVGLEA